MGQDDEKGWPSHPGISINDMETTDNEAPPEESLSGNADDLVVPPGREGFPWERGEAIDRRKRFRLIEKLGAGGTGSVWRGHDFELGRDVALKFVPLPDEIARRRLRREARLSQQVHHQRVIPTYQILVGDGWGVLVQLLAQGRTLADLVRSGEGPRSGRELRALLRGVLEGLVAIHGAGLVHRDVKASNLIVPGWSAERRNFGDVQVLDLGAAGTLREGPTGVVGTPGSMAPEQEAGETATPASDVYGAAATARDAWYAAKGQGAAFPSFLRVGMKRALSTRPKDRWPDADAWLEELHRLSVPVKEPGGCRRVLLAVAIALVVLFGFVLWIGSQVETPAPTPSPTPEATEEPTPEPSPTPQETPAPSRPSRTPRPAADATSPPQPTPTPTPPPTPTPTPTPTPPRVRAPGEAARAAQDQLGRVEAMSPATQARWLEANRAEVLKTATELEAAGGSGFDYWRLRAWSAALAAASSTYAGYAGESQAQRRKAFEAAEKARRFLSRDSRSDGERYVALAIFLVAYDATYAQQHAPAMIPVVTTVCGQTPAAHPRCGKAMDDLKLVR
jgi:serine/threonine protein kinase